jgi:DNA-nicking Smr family endonuclease
LNAGIIELDIHGMTRYQAKIFLDQKLKTAKKDIYRIRVIHGYQGGTQLRDLVRGEYSRHPKVLRVEVGLNQGSTDLVLREL